MTKILKRRIVSSSKLSASVRKEYYDADKVMSIPGKIAVETKFVTIPDVLTGATLEEDDDLEEQWLHSKIKDARYHWCHLHMTDAEWKKLKLRKSLYGSAALVKGQVITYGRWSGKNPQARRYSQPVKSLSHLGIGAWHEGDHGFRHLFKLPSTTTHYYFYGYDRIYSKQEEKDLKPKRWQKDPDPLSGWRLLPWRLLPWHLLKSL